MNGPLPPGSGLPSGVKGLFSSGSSGCADLELARSFGGFAWVLATGLFLPLERRTYKDGAIESASPCLRRRYSIPERTSSYALMKSVKAACRCRAVSVVVTGTFLCWPTAVCSCSAKTSALSSSSSVTPVRPDIRAQLCLRICTRAERSNAMFL